MLHESGSTQIFENKIPFFLSNENFACSIVFARETLQNAFARLDRKSLSLYIAQRRHVFSVMGFSHVGSDAHIPNI